MSQLSLTRVHYKHVRDVLHLHNMLITPVSQPNTYTRRHQFIKLRPGRLSSCRSATALNLTGYDTVMHWIVASYAVQRTKIYILVA